MEPFVALSVVCVSFFPVFFFSFHLGRSSGLYRYSLHHFISSILHKVCHNSGGGWRASHRVLLFLDFREYDCLSVCV